MPVLSNGGLQWPAALFLLLLAIWRWRELRQAGASRVNRRWGAAPA
jgi:hypothetical protein